MTEFPVSEELRMGAAGLPSEGGARPMMLRWADRVQELEEMVAEMRDTITRQHGLLWIVGLDDHMDEDAISDEEAVANLLKLRNSTDGVSS